MIIVKYLTAYKSDNYHICQNLSGFNKYLIRVLNFCKK
jgi:hypothetical protein